MIQIPKIKPIRLRGKAKTEFKRLLFFNRARGRCERCNIPLRLTGSLFVAAHLSHVRSYGAGGGDTEDNCLIECPECHLNKRHGPRWSSSKCGGEWYAGEWCKECHAECGLDGGKK